MSQTDHLRTTNQVETVPQVHNTFRVALLLFGATIIVDLFYFYLAFQLRAWQMVALAWVILAFGITMIFSLGAIRRGRSNLGVGLMIGGMLVIFPVASALIADLGVVLALSLILLTSTIAAQILSQKWTSRAIIASVVVGVATLLLDLFGPDYRLVVPELQTFIPTMAGLVVVIYVFFIARQFAHYSLRTKLIIAFLAVSLVSVGVIAFANSRTIAKSLTVTAGANLKSVADSQAQAVGTQLARQVDKVRALSLNKVLQDEVEAINLAYTARGDEATNLAEIEALEEQWRIAKDTDPLVQARLNNDLVSELAEFHNSFPDHVEVLVTDQYGALVAATRRPPDYDESDEAWWQIAFNEGQGAIYIGQPAIDEDSPELGIVIAVPVYAHNSENVVGVLRTIYRARVLHDLLNTGEVGQTGQSELYLPNGLEVELDGEFEVVDFDPDILAQLQVNGATYVETLYNGVPSLVSQAQVNAITGEAVIADLGWRIVVHQDRQEALAPLEAQTRAAILLALAILGLTTVGAVGVAQLLIRPLVRLTATAARVSAGDLTTQAQVEAQDEVGALATAFNAMTGRLRSMIDTLGERVSEQTQQLQTVVDISQRLTAILDISDLLHQVVTITKETFNYYHVHIYLLDDDGENLVVAEGYGQAGAELKRQAHSISFNAPQSLVARAARERKVITVENVRDDPSWLPNPLLPDTQAEMAVPVMIGDDIVGVLDVQSDQVGGLTTEDEAIQQALANQVAVAVRNARVFSQTQEALYEAQRLQRLYIRQSWEKLTRSQPVTEYEFRGSSLPPLQEITTPEALAALQQGQTVELNWPSATGETANGDGAANVPPLDDILQEADIHALAMPLKLRDQVIGVLGIHDQNPNRRWTEDEIALIEAVGEQMSLALENARLFEETQHRAAREEVIARLTQAVWGGDDIQAVLSNAVANLGETLQASRVVLRLGTEQKFGDKENDR